MRNCFWKMLLSFVIQFQPQVVFHIKDLHVVKKYLDTSLIKLLYRSHVWHYSVTNVTVNLQFSFQPT